MSRMRMNRRVLLAAALACGIGGALPSATLAVQPGKWTHTTEADFEPGKTESTVTTNLGDIKLARATSTIASLSDRAGVVFDVQLMADGSAYLTTGPETARLLRLNAGKVEDIAEFENAQAFALGVDGKGRLLVGVSAENSKLVAVEGGKVSTLVEIPGVRYIWDMLVLGDRVYLATGPTGRVLMVDLRKIGKPGEAAPAAKRPAPAKPQPASKPNKTEEPAAPDEDGDDDDQAKEPALPPGVSEVFRANQANVLCLGNDKAGRIYAGTDTDGLVYRFTLNEAGAAAESFVLFDAPEPEVGALVVLDDGTVYVGTADANEARSERLLAPAATEAGRPDPTVGEHDHEPAQKPGEIPHRPPKPGPTEDAAVETPGPAALPEGGKAQDQATTPHPAKPIATPDHRPIGLGDGPVDADESVQAQRDRIRKIIRDRIAEARKTGVIQNEIGARPSPRPRRPGGAPGENKPGQPQPPGGAPPEGMPPGVHPGGTGNAVYRISTDGFVNEVFRESCIILKLIPDGEKLLVATGNEGRLYRLDPAAGETTILARLEPSQIPAMVRRADGSVLLGTANPASLVSLESGFAKEGRFTSASLDAEHTSLWGKFNITLSLPPGTSVAVETRSGNVQDPEHAAWSAWSKPRLLKPDPNLDDFAPRQLPIESPPARFFQYRLTLACDGKETPVVDRLDTAYVVPNIRPVVKSISIDFPDSPKPTDNKGTSQPRNLPHPAPAGVPGGAAPGTPPEEPQGVTVVPIEWEASDPNGDPLRYTLEYQLAGSGKWLPLAKDLDATAFEWQTRRVPDGRYIVRVTASDAPANTPDMALVAVRNSDPVVIDNTPPVIQIAKMEVKNGVATLAGSASDALSTIREINYGIDTTEKWNAVLPEDLIYDSTTETFTVTIPNLSPGPHVVTLRVTDSRGNTQYKAVAFEVKP